jgi:VanZ family protein
MQTRLINRIMVWGIFISAVVLSVVGIVANLYERLWWFDELTHFYSFFAISLLLATLLYGATLTGREEHPLLLILTIAALGLAMGALWEISEWLYDWMVPGNAIKGKQDTMVDLVVDTVGALVAGALAFRSLPSSTPESSGRRIEDQDR